MLEAIFISVATTMVVGVLGLPFAIGLKKPSRFHLVRQVYEAALIFVAALTSLSIWMFQFGIWYFIAQQGEHIDVIAMDSDAVMIISRAVPILALCASTVVYCLALRAFGALAVEDQGDGHADQ